MLILFLFLVFVLFHVIFIDSFHLSRSSYRSRCISSHRSEKTFAAKKADIYDKEWDPKLYPKLDFNEDYYKVLEVDPMADQATIKKAYYKMMLKYHPDNRRTDDEKSLGNRQMMVINAAYKVLRNEQEKAAYDNRRNKKSTTSASQAEAPSSSSRSASSNPYKDYNSQWRYNDDRPPENEPSESFLEIFADIFNDLRNNNGVNLMNDLEEFLDNQVKIGS